MENITPFQILEAKIKHDYIWLAVAVAAMSIGLGLPEVTDDRYIVPKLAIFLFVTGFVFAALLLYGIYAASGIYFDLHRAHLEAFRVQAGLAQPAAPEAKPTAPSRVDVYLNKRSDSVNAQTEVASYDPANKPPKEFIVACFAHAQKTNKWRVTEEAAALWCDKHPEWSGRTNDWLSEMESAGIFRREWDADNAPRVWRGGEIQLDTALEMFGYDLPPPLPSAASKSG